MHPQGIQKADHHLREQGSITRAIGSQRRRTQQPEDQNRVQNDIENHSHQIVFKRRLTVPRRSVDPQQHVIVSHEQHADDGDGEIADGIGNDDLILNMVEPHDGMPEYQNRKNVQQHDNPVQRNRRPGSNLCLRQVVLSQQHPDTHLGTGLHDHADSLCQKKKQSCSGHRRHRFNPQPTHPQSID